jgi:ribosomal protein S18 acetylase RimI-like enzyme
VYSRKNTIGAAHKMIQALEEQAHQNGFSAIVLETRAVNTKAVAFYLSCGYRLCPNYGKYIGRTDAACFTKRL